MTDKHSFYQQASEDVLVILVSGSRDWDDEYHIHEELDKVAEEYEGKFNKIRLVQGGARGADAMAQTFAYNQKWEVKTYPYVKKLGKGGGDARNKKMVFTEKPHVALVFCKDNSPGAMNCWGHIVRYSDMENNRLLDGRLIEPR